MMAADDLATQRARALAVVVLTYSFSEYFGGNSRIVY